MTPSKLSGIILSGALLSTALTLGDSRAVDAQTGSARPPAAVEVVTTPLPVAATLAPGALVDAEQSGAWNVTVNNPSTNPVPIRNVDSPLREPFRATVRLLIDTTNAQSLVTTVPAGRHPFSKTSPGGGARRPGSRSCSRGCAARNSASSTRSSGSARLLPARAAA